MTDKNTLEQWLKSDGWPVTAERCKEYPVLVIQGSTVVNMAVDESAALEWIERFRKHRPEFRPTALARATTTL